VKAALALLALALAAPTAASAQGARAQATVLMADSERGREFQEKWGYSSAIIVGDTIYLSGIVAGTVAGETGFEPAYERVYQHIAGVLKRAGASWDDVVDITSFHTDVEAQIDSLAAVHKRHVKAPYPAWTAIGVARILGGGITEIKVVARRPAAAAGPPGGISKE
jgi:enamine deaminase RidA (YjgF/YER057c/UK114 family)